MPVTVIVGGQFGSEGKGKVAHYLAKVMEASVAVRVGGPNSGHTVIAQNNQPVVFKQLPTAALLPKTICVLPAGSYIRLTTLLDEIELSGIAAPRLLIDPNAVIITDSDYNAEQASAIGDLIGSTQSGTGASIAARIQRIKTIRFAKNEKCLDAFVKPTTPFLRERLT